MCMYLLQQVVIIVKNWSTAKGSCERYEKWTLFEKLPIVAKKYLNIVKSCDNLRCEKK